MMTVLLAVSACAPYLLSDAGNKFLAGFVNQELLSLLGVVVTITLASAGNLHLELNKIQDRTKLPFNRTRKAIKLSAYSLICIFMLAGALVIIKPMFGADMRATAACNSVAIVLIFFSLFVLIDLTRTVFAIPASSTLPEVSDDNP
nr:hypothetical protein [Sphingomonas sp. CDS-1]